MVLLENRLEYQSFIRGFYWSTFGESKIIFSSVSFLLDAAALMNSKFQRSYLRSFLKDRFHDTYHEQFYRGLQNLVLHLHQHYSQQYVNFGPLSNTSTFAQEDLIKCEYIFSSLFIHVFWLILKSMVDWNYVYDQRSVVIVCVL